MFSCSNVPNHVPQTVHRCSSSLQPLSLTLGFSSCLFKTPPPDEVCSEWSAGRLCCDWSTASSSSHFTGVTSLTPPNNENSVKGPQQTCGPDCRGVSEEAELPVPQTITQNPLWANEKTSRVLWPFVLSLDFQTSSDPWPSVCLCVCCRFLGFAGRVRVRRTALLPVDRRGPCGGRPDVRSQRRTGRECTSWWRSRKTPAPSSRGKEEKVWRPAQDIWGSERNVDVAAAAVFLWRSSWRQETKTFIFVSSSVWSLMCSFISWYILTYIYILFCYIMQKSKINLNKCEIWSHSMFSFNLFYWSQQLRLQWRQRPPLTLLFSWLFI